MRRNTKTMYEWRKAYRDKEELMLERGFPEVSPHEFYRDLFPEGSFEFYTEDYADTMSLAVFLISLAVSVNFAELIRAVIPINLLLLLILVHIVYVLIRWYVKGCMRSRGYY